MTKLTALLILLIGAAVPAVTTDNTLKHKGRMRTYRLHVPPCYETSAPLPVLVVLHGGSGTGEVVAWQSEMDAKADSACFIAVYPNAVSIIRRPGRHQHWHAGPRVSDAVENIGVPDVRFIAKLLRVLANRYEIDATRVYAAGISNGGMMAYRLACRLADRIAAVASVGAGMLGIVCEPLRPVSVIQFHGTLDPGWPYDGGPSCFAEDVFPPAVATIDEWRRIDDCTAPPIITYQVGAATCTTSGGCATGAEVVFCTIEGGGHTWAGGRSSLGEQILRWDGSCVYGRGSGVGTVSRDISATDEMWRFFERHRLPP